MIHGVVKCRIPGPHWLAAANTQQRFQPLFLDIHELQGGDDKIQDIEIT